MGIRRKCEHFQYSNKLRFNDSIVIPWPRTPSLLHIKRFFPKARSATRFKAPLSRSCPFNATSFQVAQIEAIKFCLEAKITRYRP